MRARLPLLVLAGSSLAFIASLYLPWGKLGASGPPGIVWQQTFDAWATGGQVAALMALVLAAAGTLRPPVALRLPLGRCGLALAYFAVATVLQVRTVEREVQRSAPHDSMRYHLAYGGYLGLAAAGIALLTVVALRRAEIVRRRSRPEYAVAALSLAILVAFLLPLEHAPAPDLSIAGILTAPATLAALALCSGLWLLRPGTQAALAGAVAVLAGGAMSLVAFGSSFAYGAWLALGFAMTLFIATVMSARGVLRPARPNLPAACTGAAAIVLLASLFLPWAANPHLDGWWGTGTLGATTGLLAVFFVAALVRPELERLVVEASLAVALFVLTLGLALSGFGFTLEFHFDFAYGAYIGFAAAGLIFVLAVSRLRFRPMDRKRAPVASAATVMSFLYLVMVVVPLWSVLPDRLQSEGPPLSEWISVASVLLSLHLLMTWIRKAAGSTSAGRRLVVIPLVLLALVTLGAVGDRGTEPNGGLVVVLSFGVVLAWLGWIEPRGFEGLRVPEAFRVDRLPETES